MSTRLTTKRLDALRPKARQYELGEPGGLRVRIYPSGRIAFVWRYRDPAGKQRVVTLGSYPALSLGQARVELAKAQAARGTGTDPAEARAQRRREARQLALGRIKAPTVADVVARYLEEFDARVQRGERSAASHYEARRLLSKHVLPALGTSRAAEITRQDLRALLRKIAATASPVLRDRVLVAVRAAFNFALEDDVVTANPAARITKAVTRVERDRVLTEAELAAIWAELDSRADHPLSWATKLALVTAQRRSSVALARWTEFDVGLWSIPASHFKGRRAHVVPLSSLALEVLHRLRARTGGLPVLFPGARLDASAHPGSLSRYVSELGRSLSIEIRTHDLRRTAATLMAAAGAPRIDVQAVLGHTDTTVTGVYDRYERLPERAAALEGLANALRRICRLEARPDAGVGHSAVRA